MKGYIYMKNVGDEIYIGSTFDMRVRGIGHKSILYLIEEAEVEDRSELVNIENYWIEQFRQWGFNLQNRLGNLSYIKGSKPNLIIDGKGIKFSDKGHAVLSKYCKINGYKLGAFCQIAALEKMKIESA